MVDRISIGVCDIARSERFHDAALSLLESVMHFS
jgi:hypothetical protein